MTPHMRRLVSYQPQYFPRLHYFARILNADVFSIADNVQFVRKHAYHKPDGSNPIGPSYQAHTPIKSPIGLLLLDYPTKHSGAQTILETPLGFVKKSERTKHLRIIAEHYRKAPQFTRIYPSLEAFWGREYTTVAELNIASIALGLAYLFELPSFEEKAVFNALPHEDFRLSEIVLSSESRVPVSDKAAGRDANDWLVDLCKKYGAGEYYFGGTGASAYMDFLKFERAGIALKEQEWKLSSYSQLHGDFIPNLSIIDLLMHKTPAEARAILRSTD